MTAIGLAVVSALLWGTADFLGGLRARQMHVVAVTLVSQLAGLVGVVLWILAAGEGPPHLWRLAVAAAGGAAGCLGLLALYRALAIGTMSIVAPVSGAAAVIPVVVGLASGESPRALQFVGMGLTMTGVVLVSQERHEDRSRAADTRRAVALALVAAVGLGTVLTLIEPASREGVAWPLLGLRVGSLLTLWSVIVAARPPVRPAFTRPRVPGLVVMGAFDTGANALYATATTLGYLSVVSVLGSLYPVMTVLLARALLGERVRPVQEAGIVTVLGGIALVAAG
jgi:drug/metabolite transporter (DMT)-like permease